MYIINVCMYVCMYIYIYIHNYTPTHVLIFREFDASPSRLLGVPAVAPRLGGVLVVAVGLPGNIIS